MEDIRSLVVPGRHGPGALERIDRPFNFVSALVDRFVEASGPTAATAAALAVGPLITWLGNRVLDLPSPQVAAVAARGVRLMGSEGRRELTFRARAEPLSMPGPQSPVDKTRLVRAQQHGPQVFKTRYRSVCEGSQLVPLVQADSYLTAARFVVRSPSRLCGSPLTSA
jgi:hypothetical protein